MATLDWTRPDATGCFLSSYERRRNIRSPSFRQGQSRGPASRARRGPPVLSQVTVPRWRELRAAWRSGPAALEKHTFHEMGSQERGHTPQVPSLWADRKRRETLTFYKLLHPLVPTGRRHLGDRNADTNTMSSWELTPIPRKTAGKIPGFPDSAYRAGQSTGVEARFLANHCESQIIFSRPYFRMSNFVNNPGDQSTDSLSRPLLEAEGHQRGRHPRGAPGACDKARHPASSGSRQGRSPHSLGFEAGTTQPDPEA